MGITDLQLGVLSEAVYSDAEPEDGPAAGFKIFRSQGNDDSGLGASLYFKKAEVCGTTRLICESDGIGPKHAYNKYCHSLLQGGKGLAVFSFRGTDSSKSSSIKGQMRCVASAVSGMCANVL